MLVSQLRGQLWSLGNLAILTSRLLINFISVVGPSKLGSMLLGMLVLVVLLRPLSPSQKVGTDKGARQKVTPVLVSRRINNNCFLTDNKLH